MTEANTMQLRDGYPSREFYPHASTNYNNKVPNSEEQYQMLTVCVAVSCDCFSCINYFLSNIDTIHPTRNTGKAISARAGDV